MASGLAVEFTAEPGSPTSYPGGLTNVNGTLFFSATNGVSGRELWKSNGTAAGTVLLSALNPGRVGALANANGTLFFSANDGVHGAEPWILGPIPVSAPAASAPTLTPLLEAAIVDVYRGAITDAPSSTQRSSAPAPQAPLLVEDWQRSGNRTTESARRSPLVLAEKNPRRGLLESEDLPGFQLGQS